MNKIYQASFILLLTIVAFQSRGQTIRPFILNSAGGVYNDPNAYYRFDWSVGEMTLVNTMAPSDSSLLFTNGLLQPLTEFIGNSHLSLLFAPGEYRLFPNPTSGRFELDFFIRETGFMQLQLTDNNGKVLEKREFDYNNCCRIHYFDLTRYPSGTYFVVARLSPDRKRSDNKSVIRHSGFRVIKIDNR